MTATEKLIADLQKAKEIPGILSDSDRQRAGFALGAVLEFLTDLGIRHELSAPLFGLYNALHDCNSGRTPPLFKIDAGSGSPGDGLEASQVKALAAAAMELLMRERHMKKQEAASEVARKIRRWGGEASRLLNRHREAKDWQTIASWRDAVKKGRREEDYGASTYYAALEMQQKYGQPPAQVANILLDCPPFWLDRR